MTSSDRTTPSPGAATALAAVGFVYSIAAVIVVPNVFVVTTMVPGPRPSTLLVPAGFWVLTGIYAWVASRLIGGAPDAVLRALRVGFAVHVVLLLRSVASAPDDSAAIGPLFRWYAMAVVWLAVAGSIAWVAASQLSRRSAPSSAAYAVPLVLPALALAMSY